MEKEKNLWLEDIAEGLKKGEKNKSLITSADLTELLQLAQEYDLTDKVKALVEAAIVSNKSELMHALSKIPNNLKNPVGRSTRIENARKKVDLLVLFITDFLEKIEKLDAKEYQLYTVEEQREPSYLVMGKNGSKDVGNQFLWRKYDIQALESQRNSIITQLESIKSSLNILNRTVSIIDTNNNTKEEQKAFDELREKIILQESTFLKIYDKFTNLIIPSHIASTIDTEKLYQEEYITAKIREYYRWKYGPDTEDETIPEWVDPNSLDFQNKTRPIENTWRRNSVFQGMSEFIPFLQEKPIINPVQLKGISQLPLQYPMYEYLSYANPEYPRAQELRSQYMK